MGEWKKVLEKELPRLGHRNFIVVADSAYPLQSAPGIVTVATGEAQVEVLEQVLKAIDKAPHVNPIVYVDAELASVPEADAPGIDAYRKALEPLLKDKRVERLPHMEIIKKLDASSELFTVLLLKTDLVLPYTSVFLELDCGYWGPEKEERLRKAMKQALAE